MAIAQINHEIDIPTETDIAKLEKELISPFLNGCLNLSSEQIKILEAVEGSEDRRYAANIVDFIYSSLYKKKNGGKIVPISYDKFDLKKNAHTFVAKQTIPPLEPVIATLRIVSGQNDLEFLDLFEMKDNQPWPHQERGINHIGEIGRLGLHPFLNYAKEHALTPALKSEIQDFQIKTFQKLYNFALNYLSQEGVGLAYYILGKNVKSFLKKAGAEDILIENAIPSQREEVRSIKEVFSGYWNPDKPLKYQPRLYIAPWSLPYRE